MSELTKEFSTEESLITTCAAYHKDRVKAYLASGLQHEANEHAGRRKADGHALYSHAQPEGVPCVQKTRQVACTLRSSLSTTLRTRSIVTDFFLHVVPGFLNPERDLKFKNPHTYTALNRHFERESEKHVPRKRIPDAEKECRPFSLCGARGKCHTDTPARPLARSGPIGLRSSPHELDKVRRPPLRFRIMANYPSTVTEPAAQIKTRAVIPSAASRALGRSFVNILSARTSAVVT
ncbi:hypothetical protein EVAR_37863_1 [Eumeta japonica]|uniref:Uncharacterized protein n=1 Tax=Eumeta variegata TaxID=151549 RepID=A0A4C1X4A5_EUMVA|nr:hypothetical protein EVAR_37863_1 [Eumeta japonica]